MRKLAICASVGFLLFGFSAEAHPVHHSSSHHRANSGHGNHVVSISWTWIQGHWERGHWVRGHWKHPRLGVSYRAYVSGPPSASVVHNNRHWVSGRWVGRGANRHWVPGHWKRR